MCNYYLAIDIGASNGRHILGYLKEGKMIIEEVYRFENQMELKNGELCWKLDELFGEIKNGMKRCFEIGKIPKCVGIDTWGVDFVLLDENNKIVGNTVAYRDSRTQGMDDLVYTIISEDKLYERTGIQKQPFNTIYQLMAIKDRYLEQMEKAKSLLMIPDYFHYLLSGVKKTEYTNSTTTQLVSPHTKDWDKALINRLGYKESIFQEIIKPGTVLGELTKGLQNEIGYNCKVVVPATHDTASAVVAVPSSDEHTLYISSGTWSLMGTERDEADCSKKSKDYNFTNEGGYNGRFRYLKNIMGLWMIQSVKKEFNTAYSYQALCEMASKENIPSIVDCNDQRFLAPKSMIKEIQNYCKETSQKVPITEAEIAAVIYNSLAYCYQCTIAEIEALTGVTYQKIHVVGGGSNAQYLNQITANYTKKTVVAGPTEATAIGNILIQMLQSKALKDLSEARNCVFKSFEINSYEKKEE